MSSIAFRLCAAIVAVGFVLTGCMTFETTLPGTLDMRKELAKPQGEPIEPVRPAFGDTDDSFFDGMILTEATDAPTRGEHLEQAPESATIYRRVMRQWFIIWLFPILADPDLVTADLKAELATPGTKATNIRITSGIDIVDFGRYLVGMIVFPLQLAPTRTTEVIAIIEKPANRPAAQPLPAAPTPAPSPDTPAPPMTPAKPPQPSLPDAPVNPSSSGGAS